jgi:hypothetical protein
MAFTLPPLPYAPTALEPHIDAQTMEIHHDKRTSRWSRFWRTSAACLSPCAARCATTAAAIGTIRSSGS